MQQVGIQEVLAGKERKAQLQQELMDIYNTTIIGVAVNMPGAVKYNSLIVEFFGAGLNKLRHKLLFQGIRILEERSCHMPSGPIAALAVDMSAEAAKCLAVDIEQENIYGRLLDIDIYATDGRQLSRTELGLPARRCLLCDEHFTVCMRERRHSLEELVARANYLLESFRQSGEALFPQIVQNIGTAAVQAMLFEALCAPAPGLVDRYNAGAHQDMDIFTFMNSSAALAPAMYQCAQAGWTHSGAPADLLGKLRRIGIAGEQSMFAATKGVNTQKGIIFLLGMLSAAVAMDIKQRGEYSIAGSISMAQAICQGVVERELESLKLHRPNRKLTAGERFYLEHGIRGVRGELEDGLPAVVNAGLPHLQAAIEQGLHLNDALVHALLAIMAYTQDTTVLNRHGLLELQRVKQTAEQVMELGGMLSTDGRARIAELDAEYSAKGISPGGAADLLAVTYFLYSLQGRI